MKLLIALLFLIVSVFLLIFATKYDFEVTEGKLLRNHRTKLTDDPKEVFWFLQISDLHLSKFKDESRKSDFKRFCSEVVAATKAKVVVCSGDITDAKDHGSFWLDSRQYQEEWTSYKSTISSVLNKTHWLDIRGNHDNFNVQELHDPTDLFKFYSAQGKSHKRSYLHQEEADGVKYNFVALDASIEPGTKRPYNFIGMIPSDELQRVEKLVNDHPSNYTVWFAHYPTSTILTSSEDIRSFIAKFKESAVFVAGHLHSLGGLIFKMYTLQYEGFLELELADFMTHRKFRVAVFDHGLFSFADVELGTWPIAIITNPKNILFNNPFKEDIHLQSESTHIRILAFSTSEITHCKVRVDDGKWMKCEQKTNNFFTVRWNPNNYARGKHHIEILVGDANGKIFNQVQQFALDGSRIQFDFLARFILMNDLTTLFQVGFFVAFVINLSPLAFFKIWQLLIKSGKIGKPQIASTYGRSYVQRYLLFASTDRIFYGILFWLVYTAVGPWAFQEIVDGHIGYLFVWGTFVKGIFVPGTLSWWYGMNQLMFFQLPLMIIIANVLHRRFKRSMSNGQETTRTEDSLCQAIYKNLPFLALLIAESSLLVFQVIQNGLLATLIAPMRFWGFLGTIFLFYQAHYRISDQSFKQSALIIESKLATS